MGSPNARRTFHRFTAAVNCGDYALGVLLGRRFVAEFPTCAPAWYFLADALIELSRYDEADAAAANAIAHSPPEQRHRMYRLMGSRFERAGYPKTAAVWYQKAIDESPGHCAGYVYLGGLLASRGKLREAEEIHRQGTQCFEGRIEEAYLNLGLVLRAQGKLAEAAECFHEALARDPKYSEARKGLRDVTRCLGEMSRHPPETRAGGA
jgi:tetratricopeptide (TPR) repeat protein